MIIMSKIIKRLSKTIENPRNVLIVGKAFGNLEDFLNNFATVFVVDTEPPSLRSRNLVFKETNDQIEKLPDIDVIVIDSKYYKFIKTYRQLWLNRRIAIVIEGGEQDVDLNICKELKKDYYQIVEVYKDYHVLKSLQ